MQLEDQVELEKEIAKVYEQLTTYTSYQWNLGVKKVDALDAKHYLAYNEKGVPTYFEVKKKVKNKIYELYFTNQVGEGILTYQFQSSAEGTTILQIGLTLQIEGHAYLWFQNKVKRKWKRFLENVKQIEKD